MDGLAKPVKKRGEAFGPFAKCVRGRRDGFDEHPDATTERYGEEQQSDVAAEEAYKLREGASPTDLQRENKEDTSGESCGADDFPQRLPRTESGAPPVESAIPTEHRPCARAKARGDGSFAAGFPIAQLKRFILVGFHPDDHFFVDIHFPAAVEAKAKRIVRFGDDQSANGNQRFSRFDLQNHFAAQPIGVSI